jgi:rhamnose utilization protein RhaD (predicted bifunctional aldolase and dehydrogenase)
LGVIRPDVAAELVAGARYLGSSVLLTQGAGGNNSVKDLASDSLWIKASGVNLSQTTGTEGFVAIGLSAACDALDDPDLRSMTKDSAHEASVRRFADAARSRNGLRPSMETGMHAALPQRAVLHAHSVYLNAFACMVGGQQAAAGILPAHRWLPYATPGFDLATAIKTLAAQVTGAEPLAIILENHGFVVAASSTQETIAISETFVAAAQTFFGVVNRAWLAPQPSNPEMLDLVEYARRRASQGPSRARLFRAGQYQPLLARIEQMGDSTLLPFVPDDVVYLGEKIWRVPSLDHAIGFLDTTFDSCQRLALIVPKTGILFVAETAALLDAMEQSALAHLLIASLISQKGVPRPLAPEQVREIVTMESEKYRQQVAGGRTREAQGCKS